MRKGEDRMRQPAPADQSTTRRAEALIAKMKAARGYIYPEWEFAARQDPEFVETYNRIYELGLGEGRHVSAKVREFVAIALLAFRGADRDSRRVSCPAARRRFTAASAR